MCNKYWNAGYDELLEMSSLPSLSDRRFTLPSVLCSEVVLLPAVFFFSQGDQLHIFNRPYLLTQPFARTNWL